MRRGKLSGDKRRGNLARLRANYRASKNAAILIRVRAVAVALLMGRRVRNQFRE